MINKSLIITEPVFLNAIDLRRRQIIAGLQLSEKNKAYRRKISKKERIVLTIFRDNLFFYFYFQKKLIGKVIYNGPTNISYFSEVQDEEISFYPPQINQSTFYEMMRDSYSNIFNWLLWNRL